MTEFANAPRAFLEATEWVCGVVAEVPHGAWSGHGLGEWDLRGLVGHTSRAFSTAGTALENPASAVDLPLPQDYFRRVRELPAGAPESVRERGVAAGAELGDQPALAFAALAEAATRRVRTAGNPAVQTIVGGMPLHSYLSTRTFEIVVHGLDICAAVGNHTRPPATALHEAMLLAAEIAVDRGNAVDLILAATGRGQLPRGFSVLHTRAGERGQP